MVDFNTTLHIEHRITNDNEDENEDESITCKSQIYTADLVMTALPVKNYPSCSDDVCSVPSLKSSNLCKQQSHWLFDKLGNFDIHLNLSNSNEGLFNSRIKVYVSEMQRQLSTTEQVSLPEASLITTDSTFKHFVKGIDNTKLTKQLLVKVSPAPKSKHSQPQLSSCHQISVQVQTNLTFIISSNLNTKYILKINGEIKQSTNKTKMSRVFNTVGNFTVEIISDTEAYIYNWAKQITVVEDLSQKVQIDFSPRITEHSPAIRTLTNVTFFIYVKGECISTPDSLNWEIGNSTLKGESVNVTFNQVGLYIKELPVKISEFPKLELPINLYDVISNFRVTFADGFNGILCENTATVQFVLSQDIGTAVQYFYAEGNSNPIHPLPQNRSISITSKNIKRMRFRAKNVVSKEEVIKNVEFTDQIAFVFKKKRYVVYNEKVTIRPEKFRACEQYNYRWSVDKTTSDQENGKPHEVPELSTTFSNVETVKVQLTVFIGTQSTAAYYSSTIDVVVEERIHFSFSNVRILLYTNERSDLTPNVSSISKEFKYKWNNRQFFTASSLSDLTETINKTDEGIFTYKLEIRNHVSRTVNRVEVYVQNPIHVIFNNEPLNVAVNQPFQVSLQFKQRSKLGYQVTVKDDDDLNKMFNITDTVFKFNHTYTNLGQVNQTFIITDIKNNKVFRSKSILVKEPLRSINVTVNPLKVRVGETVYGKVNSVLGYQRPSFYWYVTNSKGHRSQISTDAELNHTFNSIGMKQIDLEAFSSISKIVRSFNITVYDNEQLKIFTVIDGTLVAAAENITVAINSEVKFSIKNITSSENNLGLKWYIDNDEISDKQYLIHTFKKKGVIVVEVRLVDENINVLGKSNILVNVVLRLLNVDIHLYNENEKLENNSLIKSKNSTDVYLKNVIYTPEDVGHVTVNVTCIRIITNKILYQSTLHLSNFEEISILWLQKGIGEIHCRFITYNIISKIQTNFRFVFLTSYGSMSFINSPDVVKVNKQATFTIQLVNNLLPGNATWAINGTVVGMCFAAVTHEKNTTSCEYTFNFLNIFLITVEYQTEYYKLLESFKVRVADPITKVSLVPKIFEVNTVRNLTVKTNSCCVLTYLWKEFVSTGSFVTFTPKQSGRKNVTVIVSNNISTLTHTETVTIYPFFTQNNLSIKIGGPKKLAFKINEQASLQSLLHGELINLTWHVKDKNNCRQTIIPPHLFLACTKAGVYTVMLNVSTPFRYVTDIINITVIAPIVKVTIKPKHIIKTNAPVNLTASSDGTGNKKFLWWQCSVNKSWVLFNASKPGVYQVTVNVKNEVSDVSITEAIIVYKEFDFDIITASEFPIISRKMYVPPGKLIPFSIYDFDSNSLIHWKIEPNVTIHYINDTFIEIEFSSNYTDTTYLLNLTVTNNLANKTKSLYISLIKPVNIITQNLKENVIANSFYSFNFTYGGTGNVMVKSFNVTGVRNFTYIQRNGYVTVNITTGSTGGNIIVSADICNEINCRSKIWKFSSNKEVEKIEAKTPNNRFYSLNSALEFEVKQRVQKTNYTWYILLKVNQTCPNNSFTETVGNDTACRIGEGEQIRFPAQKFFGREHGKGKLITGNYTIRVIARGPFIKDGEQVANFVITVFFENCQQPRFNFSKNRSLTRSKWFYAEINVTTECNVRNEWSFLNVGSDEDDDEADDDQDDNEDDDNENDEKEKKDDNKEEDDDDDDNCSGDEYNPTMLQGLTLSTNKPVLEIPPRAFENGKYCIQNKFRYGENGVHILTIHLTVESTPLVPVIVGGMYRVIGNKNMVMLDASRTIDPDVSNSQVPSLQYTWKGNMTCLNNTDGWNLSNAKLEIKDNCLTPYKEHSFEVNVRRMNTDGKDEKVMSATQKVKSQV